MLVHAVMKQIISIAAIRIRRTNPDRKSKWRGGVGVPGLIEIVSESELFWKRHVPSGLTIQAGPGAFGRQEIVVVGSVKLHPKAPLLEIVQANDIPRFSFCFV